MTGYSGVEFDTYVNKGDNPTIPHNNFSRFQFNSFLSSVSPQEVGDYCSS